MCEWEIQRETGQNGVREREKERERGWWDVMIIMILRKITDILRKNSDLTAHGLLRGSASDTQKRATN